VTEQDPVSWTDAWRQLRQVRLQAAIARALLDELEAALPPAIVETPLGATCHQQLSDELAALARRLRDCVAALTDAER
jgi:hypothetical protein